VVTDRQTDRHTDTQTNAGENIFHRFRGDNNESHAKHVAVFFALKHRAPLLRLPHEFGHRPPIIVRAQFS